MATLPVDCIRLIIQYLIAQISPLYWPYDLIQDVQALSDISNCPKILNETIEILDNLKLNYKKEGPNIPTCDFQPLYGLPISIVPSYCFKKSNRGKSLVIPARIARYYTRSQFQGLPEWLYHMIKIKITTTITPLIIAIIDQLIKVILNTKDYEKHIDVSSYVARIDEIGNRIGIANICHAQWIFENFVKDNKENIEAVKFYVEDNNNIRHQMLCELICPPLDYKLLDIFPSYDLPAYKRCLEVSRAYPSVGMEQLAWNYIVNNTESILFYDAIYSSFHTDLQKIGIRDYIIEDFMFLPLTTIIDIRTPIAVFADNGIKAQCYIDYDVCFDDCKFRGVKLSDISTNWIKKRYGTYQRWSSRLKDISKEDAKDISEMLIRYSKLENALDKYGLKVREDSRLCEGYVMHGIGDINNIVTMMKEMHFFFSQTKYFQYLRAFNLILDKTSAARTAKLAALYTYTGDINQIPINYKLVSTIEKFCAYEKYMKIELEDYSDDDDSISICDSL
jgi:hypothetical protein